MKTIRITIPTMKSHHCQGVVQHALESNGVTLKSIGPGVAEVVTDGTLTTEEIVAVITKAGYKVTEAA